MGLGSSIGMAFDAVEAMFDFDGGVPNRTGGTGKDASCVS
jgi:hypothetical protein